MVKRPKTYKKKKYKDNRDWPKYNEQLVVRGTFFLDFSFIENWDKELEKMNDGKVGAPYQFPNSFIKWEAIWHQWLDYRSLEGIARKFSEIGLIKSYNDYSAIWHRVHDFEPTIKLPSHKELDIGTDGTGMKMTNGGGYREFKYGKKGKKKYLVVTITADIKNKKLLGIDAHVEGKGPSEPKVAIKHMKELLKKKNKIKGMKGDGKFDTNDVFDFTGKNKIKTAIPIRKNAKIRRSKSKYRRKEIRKQRKLSYKKWAKKTHYGDRWVATEGKFSVVKRKFGENLRSRLNVSLVSEAVQRFWVVELLTEYGQTMTR